MKRILLVLLAALLLAGCGQNKGEQQRGHDGLTYLFLFAAAEKQDALGEKCRNALCCILLQTFIVKSIVKIVIAFRPEQCTFSSWRSQIFGCGCIGMIPLPVQGGMEIAPSAITALC